ncbi:MAG: SMC family ATPase, partial [Chloroflexi bacterium]|nr:SMC family ATPase [Chloroflexota bacterium]
HSGNSLTETERSIERILGMSYQTFINSAFLLQGRADEFTVKSPGERKKVLADVLNLGIYECLSERAKESRNHWQGEVRRLDRELSALDEFTKDLPDLEQRRLEQRQTTAVHQRSASATQEALAQARLQWQSVQERLREQRDIEQQRERTTRLLAAIEESLGKSLTELTAVEARLDRSASVEHDLAELLAARHQRQEQGERRGRAQPLLRLRELQQRQIAAEEARLRQHMSNLHRHVERLQEQIAAGKAAEEDKKRLVASLASHESIESAQRQVHERLEALQGHRSETQAQLRQIALSLEQMLKRHATLTQSQARCPTCLQPLSANQRDRLLSELAQEGREQRSAERHLKQELSEIEAEIHECDKQERKLADEARNLATLSQEMGRLDAQIHIGVTAIAERDSVLREAEDLAATVRTEQFAASERAEIERLDRELAVIGFDPTLLEAVEQRERQFQHADAEKARLEAAAQQREGLRASIASQRQQQGELQRDAEHLDARLTALAQELRTQIVTEQEIRALESRVAQCVTQMQQAERELALLEAAIQTREQRQRERPAIVRERLDAEGQLSIAAELIEAFGRNGVQALLIEEAIPAIQDEANKLLERLTDGRMTVSLHTQRVNRAQTITETLEVRISDEFGTRNYELFSGGEAFRINLALRIALSRVLAARAGAPLETLIIDEGFGSQDTSGRQRMQEVLASIVREFRCIIVITHLDELKEAFPFRVEVYKDHTGSHLREAEGSPLPVGGS